MNGAQVFPYSLVMGCAFANCSTKPANGYALEVVHAPAAGSNHVTASARRPPSIIAARAFRENATTLDVTPAWNFSSSAKAGTNNFDALFPPVTTMPA